MIPTLAHIVTDLSTVYNDEGVAIWLASPQFPSHRQGRIATRDLSLSALDLIKEGRADEVATKVDQLVSGAYA